MIGCSDEFNLFGHPAGWLDSPDHLDRALSVQLLDRS